MNYHKRKHNPRCKVFTLKNKPKEKKKKKKEINFNKVGAFPLLSNIHPKIRKIDSWSIRSFPFLPITKGSRENHASDPKFEEFQKLATTPVNPNRFVPRTKPQEWRKPIIHTQMSMSIQEHIAYFWQRGWPESLF